MIGLKPYDPFPSYAWRSVRANGDTKTEKSRRTVELPHWPPRRFASIERQA